MFITENFEKECLEIFLLLCEFTTDNVYITIHVTIRTLKPGNGIFYLVLKSSKILLRNRIFFGGGLNSASQLLGRHSYHLSHPASPFL
jgi:hypothetical protein